MIHCKRWFSARTEMFQKTIQLNNAFLRLIYFGIPNQTIKLIIPLSKQIKAKANCFLKCDNEAHLQRF